LRVWFIGWGVNRLGNEDANREERPVHHRPADSTFNCPDIRGENVGVQRWGGWGIKRPADLIESGIHEKFSVGPSSRPICTR